MVCAEVVGTAYECTNFNNEGTARAIAPQSCKDWVESVFRTSSGSLRASLLANIHNKGGMKKLRSKRLRVVTADPPRDIYPSQTRLPPSIDMSSKEDCTSATVTAVNTPFPPSSPRTSWCDPKASSSSVEEVERPDYFAKGGKASVSYTECDTANNTPYQHHDKSPPLEKGDLLPLPVQCNARSDTASTLTQSRNAWWKTFGRAREHLMTDVEPGRCSALLAGFCLLTGFVYANPRWPVPERY